jgi:hypothetical protein
MGNRGCLHNAREQIVRDYQVTRWIICLLEFRGRKRPLMQPGHYTELFFLDEATALAAGHRPCAECQRPRYNLFLDLWAKTQGGSRPRATDVDTLLHAARWTNGRKATYIARWLDLPDGTMIASLSDSVPHLLWQGQLWRWSFAGYTLASQESAKGTRVRVLTPKPIVEILAAGYPIQIHPSLHAAQPTYRSLP